MTLRLLCENAGLIPCALMVSRFAFGVAWNKIIIPLVELCAVLWEHRAGGYRFSQQGVQ